MNQGWVIDATIGVSWVHHKQSTDEATALLKEAERGMPIFVPALWFPEIANVLLTLQRRGKITATERKASLLTIESLKLTVDEESVHSPLRAASDLAETHGLTVYDATYLEVAIRLGMGLGTRDLALRKAAKACGIRVM